MLEEIVPILKNFRDSIYRFFPSRRDAALDLVDALSSNRAASSVVELSLSPLHRRNYCSITRVLDEYLSKDVTAAQQQRGLTKLLSSLCPLVQQRGFHHTTIHCV